MLRKKTDLDRMRDELRDLYKKETARILVCAGTGCVANGSLQVFKALQDELEKHGVFITLELLAGEKKPGVTAVKSGCHGFCEMGPLVRLEPSGVLYIKVKPEDAPEIVEALVSGGPPVERLLYHHPVTGEVFAEEEAIPFYKNQQRNALANCGSIDPEEIREYIARDGYQALAKVLTELKPEDVCREITASGLRGRGGGGFPTGLKWDLTRKAKSDKKYVICNGDEGDPGAFMDRSVMEGDPHKILEGMAIAGYAVGADEGYIYVRAEYPLAVERLKKAVQAAEDYGLLGKNILGSGFDFQIKIKEGAGAFVCGEETALIASIEGKRGMPRPKPPFPSDSGLWGKPTLINNVETFANIPRIITNGAAWFRKAGTEKARGPKPLPSPDRWSIPASLKYRWGLPSGKWFTGLAAGSAGARNLKPSRSVVLPAVVLQKNIWTSPWILTPCSPPGQWSVPGAWWSWMKTPAWLRWPGSSWALRRTSPAGNAFPAGKGPNGCWRSCKGRLMARGGLRTWRSWKNWPWP